MNTVDIGLPQLAMHSPYETAGVKGYRIPGQSSRRTFCVKVWNEILCRRKWQNEKKDRMMSDKKQFFLMQMGQSVI